MRLSYSGGGQDLYESPPLRSEGDLSTSDRERVRMLRWLDLDNAEPQSPPSRCPPESPPYHQPQRGLLWSDRFVRPPPKSLWEPSCSDGEEPDLFVFPFKVFPKIAPEDDRRSCSPPVSEYWSGDCRSPYSHNGCFVFPPPRDLTWTPSAEILRALGTEK